MCSTRPAPEGSCLVKALRTVAFTTRLFLGPQESGLDSFTVLCLGSQNGFTGPICTHPTNLPTPETLTLDAPPPNPLSCSKTTNCVHPEVPTGIYTHSWHHPRSAPHRRPRTMETARRARVVSAASGCGEGNPATSSNSPTPIQLRPPYPLPPPKLAQNKNTRMHTHTHTQSYPRPLCKSPPGGASLGL